MTSISRTASVCRSLLSEDAGVSSIKLALVIGLSASGILVLARIAAAAAMTAQKLGQ